MPAHRPSAAVTTRQLRNTHGQVSVDAAAALGQRLADFVHQVVLAFASRPGNRGRRRRHRLFLELDRHDASIVCDGRMWLVWWCGSACEGQTVLRLPRIGMMAGTTSTSARIGGGGLRLDNNRAIYNHETIVLPDRVSWSSQPAMRSLSSPL
jgi:hypothetical protein